MDDQLVQTSTNVAEERNNDVKLRLAKMNEKLNTWKHTQVFTVFTFYFA